MPAGMDIWDDGMDEGGLGASMGGCGREFSICIWYLGRLARISSCLNSKGSRVTTEIIYEAPSSLQRLDRMLDLVVR